MILTGNFLFHTYFNIFRRIRHALTFKISETINRIKRNGFGFEIYRMEYAFGHKCAVYPDRC